MHAVRVHEHGGPEVLSVDTVDRPTPARDELLVAVRAAGVNPVDTYYREGSYTPVSTPFVPGVDVAGKVVETGDDVAGFEPGAMVFGTGIGNASHQGAYAEFATVPTDRVVSLPPGVDPVEAGAAGVVGVTAWRALRDHADLGLAETCLVHGGTGGVGHVAVQLGVATGATVITTARPASHEALRTEYGASTVLAYDRDDLAAAIGAAAPDGVDVILDHRLDEYLQLDADIAATGGRVVGIGEAEPSGTFDALSSVRGKDVQYTFMSMFNTPDFRVPLSRIAGLLANGSLSIGIDRTFALDEAAEAQRAVTEESFLGKLVLVPG